MSQEKVNRYKEEKANRKQTMKVEKVKHLLRKCAIALVAFALIGWLGFSAYNVYESKQPRQVAKVDYSMLTQFESSLLTE
ncbi:MAG: hypothetical protein RSA90_00320 [Lachnospiraceae bacterium]